MTYKPKQEPEDQSLEDQTDASPAEEIEYCSVYFDEDDGTGEGVDPVTRSIHKMLEDNPSWNNLRKGIIGRRVK